MVPRKVPVNPIFFSRLLRHETAPLQHPPIGLELGLVPSSSAQSVGRYGEKTLHPSNPFPSFLFFLCSLFVLPDFVPPETVQ